MKLALLRQNVGQKGYALLLAMAFAFISLLLLSSTLSWTASGTKVTERNNVYNRSLAAAEAGTEAVIGRMDRDFINQSLNYANLGLLHHVPHLVELNIGHSIVSRGVFVGLKQAVSDMLTAMKGYRSS